MKFYQTKKSVKKSVWVYNQSGKTIFRGSQEILAENGLKNVSEPTQRKRPGKGLFVLNLRESSQSAY
jgi:hypothetical protein